MLKQNLKTKSELEYGKYVNGKLNEKCEFYARSITSYNLHLIMFAMSLFIHFDEGKNRKISTEGGSWTGRCNIAPCHTPH